KPRRARPGGDRTGRAADFWGGAAGFCAAMMTQTVNLTNCDREPIHIPGSIQPHGWLLVCDARAETVLHHSANAGAALGRDDAINARALAALIGGAAAPDVSSAGAAQPEAPRPALLFGIAVGPRRFDVAVHRYKSAVIVEFEPSGEEATRPLA